jgi:glycosyltransferase involved in cell wall biosynthesis|tara:strand:- start:4215 stop:5342 length:1128 start_codon:yes stop_codon:yes gene_type:complete
MKKKIAYVINHISFFSTHILPLAIEAKKKGYEIKIFCGYGGSNETEVAAKKIIKRHKINFINVGFSPASKNIFSEFKFLIIFLRELKNYEPDIIHSISLKGILYGSIYFNIFGAKKLICFITGMGYFFTNNLKFYDLLLKKIILLILKLTLRSRNSILIIENKTDKKYFIKKIKINKSQIMMFNGVGVDLKKFNYNNTKKKNIILFPARVLIEKGINEFLSCAKILSKKYPNWKFHIAGTLNYKKNQEIFIKKSNLQNIKFHGHYFGIHRLFNESSIVCLPSYREGFPKSLIEASASGCAIVTSNVPGCRDVIKNNFNGYLCLPKNVVSLCDKLDKLINDKKLRESFCKNSRKLAEKKFDIKIFIKKNILNYDSK